MQGCHFFCTFGGMKKGLMLLGVLMLGLVALAQSYVINNNVPAGTGFTIEVDGHLVAFSDEGHFDADNMPPAVEGWLAAIGISAKDISNIKKSFEVSAEMSGRMEKGANLRQLIESAHQKFGELQKIRESRSQDAITPTKTGEAI